MADHASFTPRRPVAPAELEHAVKIIEAAASEPENGLPEPVFRLLSRLTALVNVDLLIRTSAGVLLTWRDDGVFAPGWHIPGGIIRFKETARHRLDEVARLELRCGLRPDPRLLAVQRFVYDHLPERNHFISLLYQCEINGEPGISRRRAGVPPAAGEYDWFPAPPPELLEPHKIYAKYLFPS